MDIKFKKFEPIDLAVKRKVTELLDRGGSIIKEKREFVEIKRLQSIARVDQFGRVEWRPE